MIKILRGFRMMRLFLAHFGAPIKDMSFKGRHFAFCVSYLPFWKFFFVFSKKMVKFERKITYDPWKLQCGAGAARQRCGRRKKSAEQPIFSAAATLPSGPTLQFPLRFNFSSKEIVFMLPYFAQMWGWSRAFDGLLHRETTPHSDEHQVNFFTVPSPLYPRQHL